MKIDRRTFLGFGAGIGTLGAVSLLNRAHAFGLSSLAEQVGLGGDAPEPDEFVKYLVQGTRSLALSIAEMNDAIGKNKEANQLRTFARQEPTDDFYTVVSEKMSKNYFPPEAEIKSKSSAARNSVTKAWVFGTYAGFMDKKAFDAAEAIISGVSMNSKYAEIAGTASDAVQLLPGQIKQAALVVEKTVTYMSHNGIAKPSKKEVGEILGADLPDNEAADAFPG